MMTEFGEFGDLVHKLAIKTDKSVIEISLMLDKMMDEFNLLITKETALALIARELGYLDIYDVPKRCIGQCDFHVPELMDDISISGIVYKVECKKCEYTGYINPSDEEVAVLIHENIRDFELFEDEVCTEMSE